MNHPASPLATARFYAILDTSHVPRDRRVSVCRALLAGGADLVQVRAKREGPEERERLLREVLPLFADAPGRLVVNDDVELCARHPGVGLHLGQDDTPVEEARARIGPGRLLGLSTHSWEQAAAAQALAPGILSYFCVGPLFATPTKPDYAPVGLELASRVEASRPALPLFVIGGITRANVATVAAAGLRRIVVVSDVLRAADPAAAIRELRGALG